MLERFEFYQKIKKFDNNHKYFKWWIVFIILLPILIWLYLWDIAYIQESVQGDLLYEVYAIKINMFITSLLLLPFFTISTFKVIKSLQKLINKIHPIIKLIIDIILICLIIYTLIKIIRLFPVDTKRLIIYDRAAFVYGYWLSFIYLFLIVIFIVYLISLISLKWDNKDSIKTNNKEETNIEQIEPKKDNI